MLWDFFSQPTCSYMLWDFFLSQHAHIYLWFRRDRSVITLVMWYKQLSSDWLDNPRWDDKSGRFLISSCETPHYSLYIFYLVDKNSNSVRVAALPLPSACKFLSCKSKWSYNEYQAKNILWQSVSNINMVDGSLTHSMNIWDIDIKLVSMCSVEEAPPYGPNVLLMAPWFSRVLASIVISACYLF